jgi:PTH1 family peptidyl-tRNA hydrolase
MLNNQHLIIGLGNPGKEYEKTRHNVGFEVIEHFAKINAIPLGRSSGRAIVGDGMLFDKRVHLLLPQTYMNLSGEAIADFLRQKPIDLANIIVISDDIHLPTGKIRIRASGSEGGHNGLKSITAHLKTNQYARLRFGVGEEFSEGRQKDYVLGRFSRSEREIVEENVERAAAALETWLKDGIELAMTRFNG